MDWKKLLHKLLFPGAPVVLLSIPVGFGLLAYAFLVAGEDTPIATVSYVLSAYSLVVVCANAVPLFRKGSQWVRGLPLVSQLLEDVPYRARLTLAASLGVNILYAGFNALSGLYYRSPWFGSLAAYYLLLSVMRFLLARYARRHGFGENMAAEWRHYRLCGAMLIPMNFALAGVVILVLHQEGGLPLREHAHLCDGAVRLLRHHLRGDRPGAHPKVQKPSTLRGPCGEPGLGAGVHALFGGGHAGPVWGRRVFPPRHDSLHRRRCVFDSGGHGQRYDCPGHQRAETAPNITF